MKRILLLSGILGASCLAIPLAAPAEEEPLQGTFALPLGEEEVEFFYEVSRIPGKAPLILSLHRNEATSFPAVRALLRDYPGHFVGIATPGSRRLSLKGEGSKAFTIDPNRMFSEAGIERDLERFSIPSPAVAREIGTFSEAYVKKIRLSRGSTVIAVHNNTNEGYSSKSYEAGGSESTATAQLSLDPGRDPDDFILVTNPAHFQALRELSFNVILQDNEGAPDDGSLSVFCGRNGIDYFNVEAEFGHSAPQEEMLRVVFALANGKKPAPGAAKPAMPVARPIESNAIRLDDPPEESPGKPEAGKEDPDESPPPATKPRPGVRPIEPKNKL